MKKYYKTSNFKKVNEIPEYGKDYRLDWFDGGHNHYIAFFDTLSELKEYLEYYGYCIDNATGMKYDKFTKLYDIL